MQYKKTAFYFLFIGIALITTAVTFLATATPVDAQCGSQASSCKNCHEVQGQMPVNSDGTGWHQSHAFGDFCYICHAGNNQATDKAAAHQGMVDPLSDIKASCQQCHDADLQERAKVYADILGVPIGTGNAPVSPTGISATPASGSSESASAGAAPTSGCNEIVVDDPNLINYAQRYDEIVLGKHTTNWGNTILIVLIALLILGGGFIVLWREGLISITFGEPKPVEGKYPSDVIDMLPKIAKLKPATRKSLLHFLEKPQAINKLLDSSSKSTKHISSKGKG